MKQILKSALFSLCLMVTVYDAYGSETYYIDDSPLFLYKTINWWYDSLPEESGLLCGKPIKCKNAGNAQVDYDEPGKRIDIKIKGGFAGMLSVFKNCNRCYGPSYFRCQWLNPQYLKDSSATLHLNESSTIGGFTFSNIKAEQARMIQRIGGDLVFVLEGVICGLSNGQIAMHASGGLIKRCDGAPQTRDDITPITLNMLNANNDEILATFSMVWER